ncbi:unnamed protein product [Linum tenue]|uniref:Agenet domain-containing protein n=1 Tax=Linum tenue TaxID=586396 RepID=A0AAV0PAI8_9ROSI|nr:unnamed protein product [Linum tenue]
MLSISCSEFMISRSSPGTMRFRGSWYAGTVVRREAKNTNRYVVEYDQLYADESGEKLLQETLDWVQLRPPPPPEKKVQFKFEDEVEAFYSDGWWEGAIIAEHSGGKFAVFLRGFDEQIVLEEKDLRLPVQWVQGKWEPRFEQFTQGMQVEVLTDEDGLKGAWFAATIIEPSGEDKYLIEYKTLRNDDDTEFLREVIRACNIRPCPPEIIVVDGFKVWDAVDAYYNEGWWVGVIAKEEERVPDLDL